MKKTFIFVTVVICLSGIGVSAAAQDSLILGVLPYKSGEELKQSLMPFAAYLSEATGAEVSLVVPESYEKLAENIVSGHVDVGFVGAVLYVKTKEKHPDKIHYLASCMRETKGRVRQYFYGYFLTKNDSPYRTLVDIRGKRWGFTSKKSSAGYMYPMAFFTRRNIEPDKYFSRVEFLEKNEKLTDALAAWKTGADNIIDAGAVWDGGLWEAEDKHGNMFRKIARVGPIPFLPAVVGLSVERNKKLKEKLRKALKDVPDSITKNKDFPYAGWKIGSDRDFDIVRDAVAIAEGGK